MFCARADLDRILDALIENAINYSPEGSSVQIEVLPSGIRIIDEGAGVEPDEEELVFERFARGRTGRQGVGGTGLGLAIARELAGPWKADVTIESRERNGTKATVDFSRARRDGADRD
ncbi:MAG: sensor histidine kinase [Solirubrobacterales bacterium]|nr:sensor histidine kinase [Solirubrobacterales bacterium]